MKKNLNIFVCLVLLLPAAIVHASSKFSRKSILAGGHQLYADTSAKKLKILFFLQDNVEILDFAGPMEAFTDAGFDVKTVALKPGSIITQGVLKITPDYTVDNAPKADILCFFGGGYGLANPDPKLIKWITVTQNPKYYFSVCTGAFYLAKAGLLDHLTVTTYHEVISELQRRAPTAKVLANVRYVDNGRIITTAGISAGTDGAIHLISKLLGPDAAIEVTKIMEYDRWKPESGLDLTKR